MTETEPNRRYRCNACGNLTRFDVTSSRRTRAFHHYSVSGVLDVEEEIVLSEEIEDVSCRWCGNGTEVVELEADDEALQPHSEEPLRAHPEEN